MTRDFTSEAEELMLQLISSSVVGSSIDYATPELEEYEDWKEELKSYIDSLYADVQEQIENRDYAYKNLATLFVILRGADGRTAREIHKYEEITFDSYMKTMKGLLESIRVTSGVSSTTNVDAIGQTLGGYTANPNSYVVNESIFADVNSFSAKIDDAGTGLLGQTYDRLYPKDGDWTAIDELMLKSKSEVEPWEVAALSQIIDTYVIVDEETGSVVLDYDDYEEFLEHCYIQTYYSPREYHTQYETPHQATYEISPVCEVLSGYRDAQTKQYLSFYGKYVYYDGACFESEFLKTQCYINDSLEGLCTYVPTQTKTSYDYEDILMDIDISIEPKRTMVLSVINCEEVEKYINIYAISASINNEFYAGQEEELLDMAKGNAVIDTLIFGALTGVDCVPVLGKTINIVYGIYDIYDEAENAKDDAVRMIRTNELENYINYLYCGGSVIQCEDNYKINNLIVNENQLAVDVAFYNQINEEGNQTNVTQLKYEFNNFLRNDGSTYNLEAFYEFDHGDGMSDYEHIREEDDYIYDITSYIRENYHTSLAGATMEQIEEAIFVEEKIREKYGISLSNATPQQIEEALCGMQN